MICLAGIIPAHAGAKEKQIVMQTGKEKQMKVKAKHWHSKNKKVVKVSSKGKLTAVKSGSAVVTARSGKKKYRYNIIVINFNKMSKKQASLIRCASKYLGNRYVYGGCSLTRGTDCSGFTMSLYKKFGYRLPHNAACQMRSKKTRRIKLKNLKPGDLIFYGSGKRCSHVAMYIGNKKVIHASTRKTGIKISYYRYRKPIAACRVLK